LKYIGVYQCIAGIKKAILKDGQLSGW